VDAPDQQMDPAFLFGLLAFLSSELVDRYIRLISKSSQVNATELASLPLPTANQLRELGRKLIGIRVYTPEYCDRVVRELFNLK
jgi:adenine-specific DNA-methyltransferase